TEHKFTEEESDMGFSKFLELKKLKDPCKGYIVNDTCIVEVEFFLNSSKFSKQNPMLLEKKLPKKSNLQKE
ncbi:hypothetical protein MKW94_011097, partial [Papaver nudicaule]|nr:hypothetical protein [Papaver nudicaule]